MPVFGAASSVDWAEATKMHKIDDFSILCDKPGRTIYVPPLMSDSEGSTSSTNESNESNESNDYHPMVDIARQNGDICMICLDVVKIKVNPARGNNCLCRQMACLHCLRDSLKLNSSNPIVGKCLLGCGVKFKSGQTPYEIVDSVELGRLDTLYGNIRCPRDCVWSGTRVNYQKAHQNDCSMITVKCNHCYKYDTVYAHKAECIACKQKYPKCYKEYHESIDCNGPRCVDCNILEALHESKVCACSKVVKPCSIYYVECPLHPVA